MYKFLGVFSSIGFLTLGTALFFVSPKSPATERQAISEKQPSIELAYEDPCSGAALKKEKAYFDRFVITKYEGNAYIRAIDDDKEFVFDVYQRFTDFSNSSPGILACYELAGGYKLPKKECNMEISPCRKKALKQLIDVEK